MHNIIGIKRCRMAEAKWQSRVIQTRMVDFENVSLSLCVRGTVTCLIWDSASSESWSGMPRLHPVMTNSTAFRSAPPSTLTELTEGLSFRIPLYLFPSLSVYLSLSVSLPLSPSLFARLLDLPKLGFQGTPISLKIHLAQSSASQLAICTCGNPKSSAILFLYNS